VLLRHFRDGLAALCLLGSVAVLAPAQAEVAPADARDHLSILISGHITPHCAVAARGATSLSFGPIMNGNTGTATDATLDLPFSFECNMGYTASLVSRHGGLAFQGSPAIGFSSLVDYSAAIGLGHGAGDISLRCDSSQMRNTASADAPLASSCREHSSGHDFSGGDGVVKLRLKAGGLPLLKGTYSDELVLQISPNLGG
jgi:hypothetical protein